MTEITKDNIKELCEPLKDMFLHYHRLQESIIKFQNYANLNTFNMIFGDEGERLIRHFRNDCGCNFDKFKTYLTQDQINLVLMNLHINKDYIY